MNKLTNPLFLIVAALLLLLFSSMVFIVDERERAIKLFLGEITESEYEPGLHFKVPLLETVYKFDRRRLTQFVREGVKDAFGQRTIREVVSSARSTLREEIQASVDQQAERLGIDIIDVRIKKVELPDDVRESVYQRMEKDRAKIAREIRSEGEESAKKIRASADRVREELLANAYATAEQTRGTGDAESARIYAEAFTQDPEFYSLYRSLSAYRSAFSGSGDVLLLKPDSEFFQYFNGPQSSIAKQ